MNRSCIYCKNVTPYDDEVTCDFYCEKYHKWVYEDETCDDWEEEQ